ncbi:flavodoxin family protein [Fodinibius sp. Rm-B-1B1-1]|uniref:flavodoxin family protein n=1 Tax=Fodinibius alkaliphilus TaxID=3140241 RepID=UPI003159BBC7
MTLSKKQEDLCESNKTDFSNLSALFLNCTLKPNPKESHTETLIEVSQSIFEKNEVFTEVIRPVDYNIAPGVYPDMTNHGFEEDDWPEIQQKVMDTNILIIGSPIWLGEKSSVATKVIERLYSYSGNLNDKGQYAYYGRVGGCLITGNEDGIKHCSMSILYGLQHLGYVIPPQSDAGWIGEAGPGPSYGDEGEDGPIGFDNEFTQRNTTFMTWNLMHMAHMLDQAGGIPAHGNQRSEWEAGCRFDHPNPEHR